jgi:DNA replication and repair protein RecF
LLEVLLLLATTRSPRVSIERELIRWESGEEFGLQPYARITARVETTSGEYDLELRLEANANSDSTARKTCIVNGKNVRASTMVGILKVVEFSPEDVQLVGGPPGDRRRQLDILISQIDRHYMQSSSRYGKVLAQRNGLLRSFNKEGASYRSSDVIEQLRFWDEELVLHGCQLIVARARIIAALSMQMRGWSAALLGAHVIDSVYIPGVPRIGQVLAREFSDDHMLQAVQERFARELESARPDDVRRGTTTIGPQRDDMAIRINERSLAAFGSRGQQRLGVIALKLSEADVIERLTGEQPVLLLDDALSELDESHASWLLESVASSDRQLLLTSAIEQTLDREELTHLETIRLEV